MAATNRTVDIVHPPTMSFLSLCHLEVKFPTVNLISSSSTNPCLISQAWPPLMVLCSAPVCLAGGVHLDRLGVCDWAFSLSSWLHLSGCCPGWYSDHPIVPICKFLLVVNPVMVFLLKPPRLDSLPLLVLWAGWAEMSWELWFASWLFTKWEAIMINSCSIRCFMSL